MLNKNDNVTLESLIARVEHLEKTGVPGLLDFFAASALGEPSIGSRSSPREVAFRAYLIAQAMVEERKKYVS